jgi:hypothetical protein
MKFGKIRELTIKNLVLPYVVYMGLFLYWRTEIYSFHEQKYRFSTSNYVISGIIVLLSMQFIMHEIKQLMEAGIFDYFTSFWNYLDDIPYVCVTLMMIFYITNE